MINSLSSVGYAKWVVHPLSIIGMYPYSYASALIYAGSILNLSTGISTEAIMVVLPILLGILAVLGSYLLAGRFNKNFYFRFLVALGFSTSPLFLRDTTFAFSTRMLFVAILPFFIYFLLKCKKLDKNLLLSLVFLSILCMSHRVFILLLPVIVAYLLSLVIVKHKGLLVVFNKLKFPLFSLFLIGVVLNFPLFGSSIPVYNRLYLTLNFFPRLSQLVFAYGRNIGFLSFFLVLGSFFLLLKPTKKFEEIFIISLLVSFTPLLASWKYAFSILLVIFCIISAKGFFLASDFFKRYTKIHGPFLFLTLFLILSLPILGQFYFHKTLSTPDTRYMEDRTYHAALFIDSNLYSGILASNNGGVLRKISSSTDYPLFSGSHMALIHDLATPEDVKANFVYKLGSRRMFKLNGTSINWYVYKLCRTPYATRLVSQAISKFNIGYVILESELCFSIPNSTEPTLFGYAYKNKNKIYDNSGETIYALN